MPSGWISKSRRLGIYIRDNFSCMYCGKDLKNSPAADVTLDHLVPRNPLVAHGSGDNTNENLVCACRSCNSSRQDKAYLDYATGGAVERIEIQRRLPVNEKLAKAIISNSITAAVADVEDLR